MVLAYFDFETLTCSGCGGFLPETTARENESRYVAEEPHRCHRCTAIAQNQTKYEKRAEKEGRSHLLRALVAWPTFLKKEA